MFYLHLHQIPRFWYFCFWSFVYAVAMLASVAKGQEEALPVSPPPQSFAGAYLAGRIASTNNDTLQAIDYLEQALAFAPDDVEVEQNLLLLFLLSQQFTKAVPLAERLRDVPEVEHYSHLVLVADHFNKQNFTAIAPLLEFTELDLMDKLVANMLAAWALFGQGDTQKAILSLEMLEGPAWYELFRQYNLALMYVLLDNGEGAQAAFERALDDQEGWASVPDSYERILIAYAAYLQATGDRQGAIDLLNKGTQSLPGRNVFSVLRQSVEEGKSLPFVISDAREGAAELLYSIGTALNRPVGETYARLYLNIALGLRAAHDATLLQLARSAVQLGQQEEALALYGQIETHSPYFRDGQWSLGLALADQGQDVQAIELLNALLTSWPDDENLAIALSSVYMHNKDYAAVIALLDNIIKKYEEGEIDAGSEQAASSKWRIIFQRGIAHERLQQWDKAEADFRTVLVLSPEQPQVLNYLGYSLIDRDMKLGEALEMVRRAAALRPTDGAIIDSLGWAYYKLGRYDEAVEQLEMAVRLQPEDPTINDHLGDAYWQVGRKFEATFQWNHALAGDSELEAREKIEAKLKGGLESDPSVTAANP